MNSSDFRTSSTARARQQSNPTQCPGPATGDVGKVARCNIRTALWGGRLNSDPLDRGSYVDVLPPDKRQATRMGEIPWGTRIAFRTS